MPIIEPGDQKLKDMKGLHLWHGDLSSCSQRVRVTLAEKGLEWESHPIDIPKMEHATPEYQAIHPKGLVPAFVDNGTLLIESCDIIQYLDETYPGAALMPADRDQRAEAVKWIEAADRAQDDLKLLSHEFLFRDRRSMSEEEVERFCSSHQNEKLVSFMREYQSTDMFDRDKIDEAVNRTDAGFQAIDSAVAEQDWIVGNNFTLADVAWMPNVHRMALMDWPLDNYPSLMKWFERVQARPSYQSGLVAFEPAAVKAAFKNYSERRADAGSHVSAFGVLAERAAA